MITVSGRVEFSGGKLERGIHLFARSNDRKHSGDAFIQPGQQEFQIGPVPRGLYTIEAHSTEIDALTLRDVQLPAEKELTLKINVRGSISLRGQVVRADNQKPVTQFRAQVTKTRTLSGPNFVQDPDWKDFKDEDGKFKIDVAGPGIYIVQVRADGLGVVTSKPFNTDRDGQTPIRIEMTAGTSLVGTVVDEQGNLVNGAKIVPLPYAVVRNNQALGELTPGEPALETRDGKFTMPALPDNQGVIKVEHPGFAPTVVDTTASKDASGKLRIVLCAGATVRGRVYDANGKPEPNVLLYFQDRDAYGGHKDDEHGRLATAVSDENGNYEVRHLPEQLCYVQRADPWQSLGVARHSIWTTNGKVQTLDFGGLSMLSGRLTVNGRPLSGERVQLSGGHPSFGIFKAFARTDQDGAFTFWGPPPGERTLYYTTKPQANTWTRVKDIQVTTGSVDLGVIDSKTAKLTVLLDPASAGDTEGVRLEVEEFNPKWPIGNEAGKLLDRTNRSSPFVFDSVPVGKYEIVLSRPNQLTVRQMVEIRSNEPQTIKLNLLLGTASLSGRIAKSICGPDGCSALKVWSSDQRLLGMIVPKEDGSYLLENIPAGEYVIKDKDARDADALLKVSLRDQEKKTLDITAENTATQTKPRGFIEVYVVDANGITITGPQFEFDRADAPPTLSSSQDGRMLFVAAPGVLQATITYPGYKSQRKAFEFARVNKDGKVAGTYQYRISLERGER
jgi:hypothetical protein